MKANIKKNLKFQNWAKIKYLYNRIFSNYTFLEYFFGLWKCTKFGQISFEIMFIYSFIFQKKKLYHKKFS